MVSLAFGFPGCGSDDTTTAPADNSSQCTDKGGVCVKNFPFLCPPGQEASTGALSTVCGQESPASGDGKTVVYPCCFPAVIPPDTGTDVGADAGDAPDAADAADATDAADALEAGDATPDGTDAMDATDAKDASDAG